MNSSELITSIRFGDYHLFSYFCSENNRMMGSYDGINWFVYQELGTKRTCYNHINWGYDGDCNGYFNFDVFN